MIGWPPLDADIAAKPFPFISPQEMTSDAMVLQRYDGGGAPMPPHARITAELLMLGPLCAPTLAARAMPRRVPLSRY